MYEAGLFNGMRVEIPRRVIVLFTPGNAPPRQLKHLQAVEASEAQLVEFVDKLIRTIGLAGMEPLRADEEMAGGIIHQPMYERLILCEYAVADLTTVNANVFYELGLRHAVREWSTVSIFASGGRCMRCATRYAPEWSPD